MILILYDTLWKQCTAKKDCSFTHTYLCSYMHVYITQQNEIFHYVKLYYIL
jgi:hypothetical protein